MIAKLKDSERFKKDLNRYKSCLFKCDDEKRKRLSMLIDAYENFVQEIDDAHSSNLGSGIRPVMARDSRLELVKMREKLDKFISDLDS